MPSLDSPFGLTASSPVECFCIREGKSDSPVDELACLRDLCLLWLDSGSETPSAGGPRQDLWYGEVEEEAKEILPPLPA